MVAEVNAEAQQQPPFRYRALRIGDPVPYFKGRTPGNARYNFDSAAGRFIVLAFVGSAASPRGAAMVREIAASRHLFDDQRISLFFVSSDPGDEARRLLWDLIPGIRVFWDFDGAIGRAYGALPMGPSREGSYPYRQHWLVIEPNLRVRQSFEAESDDANVAAMAYLAALPPADLFCGVALPAPVIILPNVFEPDLCRHLIGLYEAHGGVDSGFMVERDGVTTSRMDYSHKRRRDYTIEDADLMHRLMVTVHRRVVPEIAKVHQFHATRMERYIVACYDADERGHFNAHRDNTTKGTAHRRFALSVILNDDFDGGEVGFPEFGSRGFKAPAGGAVVFSCSLLHKVSPVTRGRRYVFLPFLYDDAAAAIREQNNPYLDPEVGEYSRQS